MNILRNKFVDRKGNAVKIKRGPTFPIHSHAIDGNIAHITKYISAGADMDCRDKQGRTPLHEACCTKEYPHLVKFRSSLQLVTLLIKSGANPMTVDNVGDTPLHCVARHKRNRDVAAYLVIECKVSLNSLNKFGQTPLDVAKECSCSLLDSLKISPNSLTASNPQFNELPEVLQFLLIHDNISNRSLRELARHKILQCLHPYSNDTMDMLPLPEHIKCYLGGISFINWLEQ